MARLPKGSEWVMYLRQSYILPDGGGRPAFVTVHYRDCDHDRDACLFPGKYPAFIGTGAWFRLIRHKRGAYTFLERVAGKGGEPFCGPW